MQILQCKVAALEKRLAEVEARIPKQDQAVPDKEHIFGEVVYYPEEEFPKADEYTAKGCPKVECERCKKRIRVKLVYIDKKPKWESIQRTPCPGRT